MPNQIVMVLMPYSAETPEDARRQVEEIYAGYEGMHLVFAAESIDQLPHPSQVVTNETPDGGIERT